jgi:hypothetical protein
MRRLTTLLASLCLSLIAALAVAGCDSSGPENPSDPAAYFVTTPYANPACNVVDQELAGQRQMHLYTHGASIATYTQGLARYYQRHSLSFVTPAPAEDTSMSYALNTNQIELTAKLQAAFPGVDLNDEAALMADPVLWNQIVTYLANLLLAPMVDFATAHSQDGQSVTNFVVIPDLERPGGSKVFGPGEQLAGLSVSPALLAAFAQDPSSSDAQFWQGVAFPDGFTPMTVLGDKVLQTVKSSAPELMDLVAAHEFGHSASLVHRQEVGNLMYPGVTPGVDDCTNSLDQDQLASMRTALGLETAAGGALLAAGAPATPAPAARTRPAFTPAHLRALVAGDQQALRPLLAPLLVPSLVY